MKETTLRLAYMRNLAVLMAAVVLAGCASTRFTPYAGSQAGNPTAPGSVMEIADGMPIYYGLPSRPYAILGRLDVDEPSNVTLETQRRAMLGRVVKAAREAGANAAIIQGTAYRSAGTGGGGFAVSGGNVVPLVSFGATRNALTASALLIRESRP